MKKFTEKQLYEFCRDHYYCPNGEQWQPFENWHEDDLEDVIDNDVTSLKNFIGWKKPSRR